LRAKKIKAEKTGKDAKLNRTQRRRTTETTRN